MYAPRPLGRVDVLVGAERILHVQGSLGPPPRDWGVPVEEVDLSGCILVPGLIDQHVHIVGGGGEAGYHSRTPEVVLSALTRCGITTVVGLLGTDGVTRHMASLVAKARGLEHEGISAWIYTGNYHFPLPTITGSVRSDLVLVDKVVGAGEIAVSDHRSSQPTLEELKKVAAEARVGGMLSGKAGVVHFHLGDGRAGLEPLRQIVATTEIPIWHLRPTHLNRNPRLFDEALDWHSRGGWVDVTTGVSAEVGVTEAVHPAEALRELLRKGGTPERITLSSDGNGSMPLFDAAGRVAGLLVADPGSLWATVRAAVLERGVDLEQALPTVTCNVADGLKLPRKGRIAPGCDADLVVLTADLGIRDVYARGRLMVKDGSPVVAGTFEVLQPRGPAW